MSSRVVSVRLPSKRKGTAAKGATVRVAAKGATVRVAVKGSAGTLNDRFTALQPPKVPGAAPSARSLAFTVAGRGGRGASRGVAKRKATRSAPAKAKASIVPFNRSLTAKRAGGGAAASRTAVATRAPSVRTPSVRTPSVRAPSARGRGAAGGAAGRGGARGRGAPPVDKAGLDADLDAYLSTKSAAGGTGMTDAEAAAAMEMEP